MSRFDVHLCLVSEQATPNLAPLLAPGFAPRRATLAVSAAMRDRAGWLEAVARRHGIAVDRIDIGDPFDFHACAEAFLSWLGEQEAEVALNVTGGTKVMAMAAQEVFRSDNRPVFYVNADNDHVIFIDRRHDEFTLPPVVRLREFLEAHGYTLAKPPARPEIRSERRDFVNRLLCDSERLGAALGRLNALAQDARQRLESPALDARDEVNKVLDELIDQFAAEGLITRHPGHLRFPDEAARQFVNGGWLEYAIGAALSDLTPECDIRDYATGLEVLAPDGKTRNELDACFLRRNTLHLVECKTANLAREGNVDRRATEAIYKLDALRRIGGLRTRALLVDYRGSLGDADRGRAQQSGLCIVSGRQLRDLRGALKAWIHDSKGLPK